jgi:hypothetical protein
MVGMCFADSQHRHRGLQSPELVAPSPCTTLASNQRTSRGALGVMRRRRSASCAQHRALSILDEESKIQRKQKNPAPATERVARIYPVENYLGPSDHTMFDGFHANSKCHASQIVDFSCKIVFSFFGLAFDDAGCRGACMRPLLTFIDTLKPSLHPHHLVRTRTPRALLFCFTKSLKDVQRL